jgi:hypothetical protein
VISEARPRRTDALLLYVNANHPIQREFELFEAVRHLTGPARRAFLEQACLQDPATRDRIEELVALQSDAEKFFAGATDLASLLRCSTEDGRPKK